MDAAGCGPVHAVERSNPVLRVGASPRDRLELLARLTALLEAGLPIPDALAVLAADGRDGRRRARLQRAQLDVEAGADLTSALVAAPALVDAATASLLHAGERSGSVVDNLRTAQALARRAAERRARLRGAAVYPAAVLVLAIGTAVVMALVVLPRLASTYSALGGELPRLTAVVLALAGLLRSGGLLPAAVVVALALVIVRRALLRLTGRRFLDLVPVVGRVRRELRTVVILEVLSSLLRGGLAFVEAVELTETMTDDPALRRRLSRVALEVRSGRATADAVAGVRLVPGWVAEVVAIGERTGGLTLGVARAAEVLGERTERRAQDLATAIEPLMLAGAGAIVGTVVLALYLPLFRVVDLVR